jgi:hypothetical protein
MNYSGIDLHSNNSVVSVIDETDRVFAEKTPAQRPDEDCGVPCAVASWTGRRRSRIHVQLVLACRPDCRRPAMWST